jgi:uncharacterized membrane protein YhdT
LAKSQAFARNERLRRGRKAEIWPTDPTLPGWPARTVYRLPFGNSWPDIKMPSPIRAAEMEAAGMAYTGKLERNFWRFWLGGLLILAIMIAANPLFVNDVSPWGIRDHQSAASAARVDAIQAAWQAAGVMNLARWAMALDLVYIAVYAFGAFCGGRMFRAAEKPALRRLGWIIMAAATIMFIGDNVETICQLIQAMRFEGDDRLAKIAATAQPIKSTALLTGFFAILAALFLRRRARRAVNDRAVS